MELSGSTAQKRQTRTLPISLLFLLRKQAQFSDWNIFWTRRYIKKQSTPFDRASPKAQSMDFSKAFLSVVLSYAMRSLEFWAPKIVFFCSYLRNLWQCHQALIWLAGCGAGVWGYEGLLCWGYDRNSGGSVIRSWTELKWIRWNFNVARAFPNFSFLQHSVAAKDILDCALTRTVPWNDWTSFLGTHGVFVDRHRWKWCTWNCIWIGSCSNFYLRWCHVCFIW